MKKLALSMRISEAVNYSELRNSIAFNYVEYFENLGFIVILIPNNTRNLEKMLDAIDVEGIVLTGGNNVSPKSFNPKVEVESVYPVRDNQETNLINYGAQKGIPILGICRGFQFINVFFGGSLIYGIEGHVSTKHELDSKYPILNKVNVNSFHEVAIGLSQLSEKLSPLATTGDSIVEAFIHKQMHILGVQWHPEREKNDAIDKFIFNFLNKSYDDIHNPSSR